MKETERMFGVGRETKKKTTKMKNQNGWKNLKLMKSEFFSQKLFQGFHENKNEVSPLAPAPPNPS